MEVGTKITEVRESVLAKILAATSGTDAAAWAQCYKHLADAKAVDDFSESRIQEAS